MGDDEMVARSKTPSSGPIGPRGEVVWDELTAAYVFSPGELELVRQVCHAVDLIAEMDARLAKEDLLVRGSMGQPRPHPLIAAVGQQRRVLETLLRALALPMPDEVEGRRRSPEKVAAAQARWREQRRDKARGSLA